MARIKLHKLVYTYDYTDYTMPTVVKLTTEDVVEVYASMKPIKYTIPAGGHVTQVMDMDFIRDRLVFTRGDVQTMMIANKELFNKWYEEFVESIMVVMVTIFSDTSSLFRIEAYLGPRNVPDTSLFSEPFYAFEIMNYGSQLVHDRGKLPLDRTTKLGYKIYNEGDEAAQVVLNQGLAVLVKKEAENILQQWITQL